MTKQNLSAIPDDKPIKISIELPAPVFRDLQAYAASLARTASEAAPLDPAKLLDLPDIEALEDAGLLSWQAVQNEPLAVEAESEEE
ncbi:MAG: DUF2274 domain-containing protein [Hydrogenophaga sp.]|nr:DUF2274 domain-containing protein [Hydrogenophaga sp.]